MTSRTQFKVLGLEASSPRKSPNPRLEDRTVCCTVEILLENARNLAKNLQRPFLLSSIGDCRKKFLKDLFFLENTCACVLGFGLEHSCPWPQKGLSSEGLSLTSDFFVSLALTSSLVSSAPPLLSMRSAQRKHDA